LAEKDRRAFYPILAVGFVGAAMACVRTGRDALFFDKTGVDQLPIAYLFTEIGLFIGAYVHLAAMARFGARKVRVGLTFFAGIFFLCFSPFVNAEYRTAIGVLFPVVPVVFAAILSATWLLAGDVLEGAEMPVVRRAYSYIGASGMIGSMLGSVLARGLSEVMTPALLVGTGAVLLFVVSGICRRAHNRFPVTPGRDPAKDAENAAQKRVDLRALSKQPYVRMLFVISALASLAGMYIEFRFYAIASASGKASAGFFADYNFILALAALATQLVVAPRVQARFGVALALTVLPMIVLGGAGLLVAVTTLFTQSLLRVVETGVRSSIHRTSWEQVFLPFSREERSVLKVLIDGAIPRFASVFGALALFVAVRGRGVEGALSRTTWVPIALFAMATLWIAATRTLRRMGCDEAARSMTDPVIRLPDS
jgi:hypothetical protein